MWCACMFRSVHGLRLCFLHLDSALCLSLCPLVFNTAVRPPVLNVSVFVCFPVGDGWRWESDILSTGWTETWNGVLCSGMVGMVCVLHVLKCMCTSDFGVYRLVFFPGPLQPRGHLRLSQSWDLEWVEPSYSCVHAPQWWAHTHSQDYIYSEGIFSLLIFGFLSALWSFVPLKFVFLSWSPHVPLLSFTARTWQKTTVLFYPPLPFLQPSSCFFVSFINGRCIS